MRNIKKLLSCAAAATLAVTGIVGGASLGANAANALIENGGPYEGDATYISTYMSTDYYRQEGFVIKFKYDTVGKPSAPQSGQSDLGYNDTFEFLVFDEDWKGWDRTTVGPTGYDQTANPDVAPEEGKIYTVTVPIETIEKKLSTGKTPFGINLQTGTQLGTSKVTIVSLAYQDIGYEQPEFTVTGNWTKGTASTMTVSPADAAVVDANEYNIMISAIDLSSWYNPTVEVTVKYAETSSDFVQAEIGLPTGETDPETGGEIYKTPDPNYIQPVAGERTFVTEIPNTTTRFMAAYDQCTVTKIYVYDNNAGLVENPVPVTGQTATTIKDNMGLAWNLGNALEMVDATGNVNEKATGNAKATRKLIQAVKAAGFNTLKIPVSFLDLFNPIYDEDGNFVDYGIDDVYLARIQQVVNYAYDMDMYSIVSLHGDGMPGIENYWINIDATEEEFDDILNKYGALWSDIAQEFAGYDQKVLFQAGNEFMNDAGNYAIPPTQIEYDRINALDQAFVNAVRNNGAANNLDRVLLVVGYNSNIDYTIAGFKKPADPGNTDESGNIDDSIADRLMLSVNYYDPTDFTLGSVTNWDPNGQYGTSWMDSQFKAITNFATGLGMPVMIGEYGPEFKNGVSIDLISLYNYWVNYYAATYGIVTAYWDNGETSVGGTALFNRDNNTITSDGQAIVNAIKAGYNRQTYPPTTP